MARIEELRLEALELRAEAQLRIGNAREQIGELEGLHAQHPLRERFAELLMRSLYQGGRQADALRAFDKYRRTIGEELGIEPSPELRRIEEQILLHDPAIRAPRHQDATTSTVQNPFKGLRSFGEDDAADFFGRDRVVSELIRRLDDGQRLVALVGSSGSGKSSVVRAGVIPSIRKGAIDGSDKWLVAQMIPGAHPLVELEAALLRSTLDSPESLTEQLTGPDEGLLRAAIRILPENSRLLLVIDQFEELFTLVDSEAERTGFLELLGPALDDPHGRILVLLTLRADFYDRPLSYPSFVERLGDGIVNLTSLSSDELEDAARKPMRRAVVEVEPALLVALLTDIFGQPGALPLFQYALTMLFDRRQNGVITLETYRAMGGLKGDLTKRAEELLSKLSDAEVAAAQQLFLRLVTITGDGEWSRRRVPASELTSLRRDLVATQRVIESFGEHRLLAFDRDHVTGSPTVEVAHEALLTEWPRLRAWIDEARDDVIRHAAHMAAMNEWVAADRNPDYLLGGRLSDYEAWAGETVIDLSEGEEDFMRRSVSARDDADRNEAERTERESTLAMLVRRRTVGLLVALLILVSGSVATWALTRSEDLANVAYVLSPFGGSSNILAQLSDGWDQAQRDHDFEAHTVTPRTDLMEEIAALAASGTELVVVSLDVTAAVADLAAANPGTWFINLSTFNNDPGLPNITTVYIDAESGAYLAGAAAALESQTGIIGFVGASPGPNDQFRSGYEAGASAIDPEIEVLSTYLIDDGHYTVFLRPEEGADAARALYKQRADVVFHAAGDSGNRIPAAADELSTVLGRHLWAIGVDFDQWLNVGPGVRDHVLTSMVKRHDLAMRTAISLYLEGDLKAGPLALTLAEGSVGYSQSGQHLTTATIERLDEIHLELAVGVVEAPRIPNAPPTHRSDADVTIDVSVMAEQCDVAASSIVSLGDTLGINVENRADVDVGVNLMRGEDLDLSLQELYLSARRGQPNAGQLRPADDGVRTISCVDANTFDPIGVASNFLVVAPDDADLTGQVVFDVASCTYEGEEDIPVGSRLAVDITNESEFDLIVEAVTSTDPTVLVEYEAGDPGIWGGDILVNWVLEPGESKLGILPVELSMVIVLNCFSPEGAASRPGLAAGIVRVG